MLDKNILIGGRFKSGGTIFAIDVADVQALSPRTEIELLRDKD